MGSRRTRRLRVAMLACHHYVADARMRRAAEALVAAGHRVDLFCLGDPGSPTEPGSSRLRFFELPMSRERGGPLRYGFRYGAFLLWTAALVAVRHLRRRYDVVYVHNMPNFLVFSGAIPRLLGAKVLLDVRDPPPELLESILGDRLPRWVFRLARAEERLSLAFCQSIITVNEPMRERVADLAPAVRPVEIVMNLPDPRMFSSAEPTADGVGTDPDPPRIAYSGTIARRHGVDLMVRALALLGMDQPHLRLVLVGEGPEVDPLRELARSLGVEQRVEFLGLVPLEEVASVLRGASAGVSPLRSDPFGSLVFSVKVPEYLALGLPVICSRTRTMEQYFGDDELTFFEPDEPEDLARAILEVLKDPQGARRRSARARRTLDQLDQASQRETLVRTVESLAARRTR